MNGISTLKLVFAIFLFITLIFLIVTRLIGNKWKQKKANCNLETIATIVDYEARTSTQIDDHSTSYYGVYDYEVSETRYKKVNNVGIGKRKSVPHNTTIMVDQQNPETFYDIEENEGWIIKIFNIIIGILIVIDVIIYAAIIILQIKY